MLHDRKDCTNIIFIVLACRPSKKLKKMHVWLRYFVRTHHCVQIITFYLISYKNVIFNCYNNYCLPQHLFRSVLLALQLIEFFLVIYKLLYSSMMQPAVNHKSENPLNCLNSIFHEHILWLQKYSYLKYCQRGC